MAIVGWLAASALVVRRLVARPEVRVEREAEPAGLDLETVTLVTADGEHLGAWFRRASPGRALVLLLHGMGGTRRSFGPHARRLASEGFGFLVPTLRGFGDSSGERIDFGWSSRADVIAAVEYLERVEPEAPRVIVGQSLGAAAAIFAAEELGQRVNGYVLEAPYRDLEKACRDRLARHLAPPLAAIAFAGMRLWAPLFLPVAVERLRPIDAVTRFPAGVPALFVAGARDELAGDVRELAERCSAAAELVVLAGRDHKDLWTLDDEHWALWRAFLERVERVERAHAADASR